MASRSDAASGGKFDALYKKWGGVYGVDWRLIKAHALRESAENPRAFNPERPDLPNDGSYGIGQIYCVVGPDGRCSNRLSVDGWPPHASDLYDADKNIHFMAQIIAANTRAYGMPRAVAVYNSFDQHRRPLNGPFKNQGYVDDVLRYYEGLKNV